MNKIINFLVIMTLAISGLAQNPFGMSAAKPEASYTFNSSITYKISLTDKKGKKTEFDTQYYFKTGDDAIGVKMLGGNDPDMKKAAQALDFMVLDLSQSKMFNFMNHDGQKMVMGMAYREDKLLKAVEKENSKISVTKTTQTKTILGHKCDGYAIKDAEEKSDVVMWVSQGKVPVLSAMNDKMGKIMTGKQTNYLAYNVHPELVKIAKEGRGVLGYTTKSAKGELMDMELTEIKDKDSFTFKSSDYKSMF